jgi:two-component sensor histidine kinase
MAKWRSIYLRGGRWKWLFFAAAVGIAVSSVIYTNRFIADLEEQERNHIKLWALAYRDITASAGDGNVNLAFEVIRSNQNIPAILTDQAKMPIDFIHIDSSKILNSNTQQIDTSKALKIMGRMSAVHEPIQIVAGKNTYNYIYYDNSTLLKAIEVFPFLQLAVIAIFLWIAYFAFMASRKHEQDFLWVGMAKETAHQLGTPISSLMAWLEVLRIDANDTTSDTLNEVKKDIQRLELITDRFSKIGSTPQLEAHDLKRVLDEALDYLKLRVSSKVIFEVEVPQSEVWARINPPLFHWVIENIVKNAVDAMEAHGTITFQLQETPRRVYLDIVDTGKGIPASQLKSIFNPGVTSKKRGWGLGLSLVKRIVENYHNGKVFVKQSEIGKGSTFRISLPLLN